MLACFAVLGNIASSTRKLVNNVTAQAIGPFIFNWKKLEISDDDLKTTLILQKGRLLLLFFLNKFLNQKILLQEMVKL